MISKLTIKTYPNEAAAAYIRGKAVSDPENFGNLPDQFKQRAFMVAGIEKLDAVKRIRDVVAKLPVAASWDEAKRVIALDEEDAQEIGITKSDDMPMPERSGKLAFDPTNVATIQTHTNGDNTPSPRDILFGFENGSKAEYIAAGKKLRRWVWLKTPEADDIALLKMYDADNNSGGVNFDAYWSVITRLIKTGYIKMGDLS